MTNLKVDGSGRFNMQPVRASKAFPEEEESFFVGVTSLDKGLETRLGPRIAPLESCSAMSGFKFAGTGIVPVQDFSDLPSGGSVITENVRAIVNTVQRTAGTVTNRTIAISSSATVLRVWSWSGSTWTLEDSRAVTGHPLQPFSAVALQNQVVFAPGGDQPFYTWDEAGGTINIVDATADIRPRYLIAFGDRVIALQDLQPTGDETGLQSFAWSQDGDILDFSNTGSGQSLLIDTRSHSVDEIQGGAALSANVLGIIRQRSIMRAFETGNSKLAVGVVHWIEGVGSESPFSIAQVENGICFLGHDYMTYFLTETGLTPIGSSIQEELLRDIDYAEMNLVQGTYDYIQQEYWMGIVVDGDTAIQRFYIFSLGHFIITGEKRWRRWDTTDFNGAGVTRMGYTSEAL